MQTGETSDAEKELAKLGAIVESSEAAIIGKNLDGTIESWNAGAEYIYGYSAAEAVGKTIAILIPADRRDEFPQLAEKIKRGEAVKHYETERIRKDGERIWMSLTVSSVKDPTGAIVGASVIGRDITERKGHEREIVRLNRLYATLSQINHNIVHVKSREELFQKVCRVTAESGGFEVVWIGRRNPETQEVVPVGRAGATEGYLDKIKVYADDRPEGHGPVGTCIRENKPCIFNDFLNAPEALPWHKAALAHNLRAVAALPIHFKDEVWGAFSVYDEQAGAFGDKEIALLAEAAMDISYAMESLEKGEQRQAAETALRASELRYRRLFESAKDGILILDAETGMVVDVNPFLIVLLGYSREAFLEKKIWELGFFKDIVANQDNFAELQQKQYIRYDNKPLETKDGRRIQVEFVSNVYLVNGRKVIQCNIRDITERDQVEKALRESEKKHRLLFESSRDAILTVEPSSLKFTSGNPAALKMFGSKNEEEFVSIGLLDMSPDRQPDGRASAEKAREIIKTTLREGSHFFEWMHRRIGGEEFPADVLLTRMERSGKVIVQASVRDITERKRTELVLHREQEFTRTLLDNIADGVVACDAQGTLVLFNQTARVWHGMDALALRPEEWGRHYSLYEADGITPLPTESIPLVRAFRGKTVHDAGMVIVAKGQPPRHILASGCPFFDAQHNLLGAMVVMRDITKQKREEEERETMLRWQRGINLLQQSLLASNPLEDKLKRITDSIIRIFGADFCRVWLIRPGDLCEHGCVHAEVKEGPNVCRYRERCLHLMASSGRYTHIDGKGHRRVPFDAYKIGRIASGKDHKFLTNDVSNDPHVHNHQWARELGLVSFAGYQLRIPGGETLGVLALFARHPVLPAEDALLDGLSSALAQVVQQAEAEGALRTSEERTRTITDSAQDAILMMDAKGRVSYWNPAAERIFGYTRAEAIGQNLHEFIMPASYLEAHRAAYPSFRQTGQGAAVGKTLELEARRKDGKEISVQLSLSAIQMNDGWHAVGILRDITEQKRVEGTLRLHSDILQNMTEGVHLIRTEDARFVYANPALEHMFGYDSGELIGKHVSVLNAPSENSPEDTAKGIIRTLNASGSWHGEVQNIRKDGTLFWCHANVSTFEHSQYGRVWISIHQDITERKRAEEALADEANRRRILMEGSKDGIVILDQDGKVFEANRRYAEMLGYSPDEVRQLHVWDWDTQWTRDQLIKMFRSVDEAADHFETRHRRKDGTVYDVEISSNRAICSGQTLIFCVCRDITERKRAEEDIQFRNVLLSTQQEASIDGILVVDEKNRIISYNRRFIEMWGVPAKLVEDKVDEPVRQFVAAQVSDPLSFQQRVQYLYEHRQETGQDELILADGRAFDRYSAPMFGPETRYYGRVWYFRDITERVRAEESHTRLVTAVEQAAETIVITDINGAILFVNPAFEKTTGYTREEAIGQNSRILKSGKQDAAFYQRMWAVLSRREVWNGHVINKRKDGTLYEEEASISPVRNAAGKVVNYVAVKRDVTHEVAMEAQLRQAQKMEAIGTLAGGVAHEINNPVNGIMNYAQLITDGLPADSPLQKFSANIIKETNRVSEIVRNLLAFARQNPQHRSPASLNDILKSVLTLVQTVIKHDQITLLVEVPEGLPQMECRSQQLEQVLLNLLTNARDSLNEKYPAYHEDKIIRVTACLFERDGSRWIRTTVEDHANGIPERIRDRILDPFFTTKVAGKGTGLGLSISHGIVKEHGGELNFETETGRGTRFHMDLPVKRGK